MFNFLLVLALNDNFVD